MKRNIIIVSLVMALFAVVAYAGQFQLNQKHEFIQRLRTLSRSTINVNTEWNALYTEYVKNDYSNTLTQEDIDNMGSAMGSLEVGSVSTFLANKTQWDIFYIDGNIVTNAEKLR